MYTSPCGGILSCTCYSVVHVTTNLLMKFETYSFIHSKYMKSAQNLEIGHVTLTTITSDESPWP